MIPLAQGSSDEVSVGRKKSASRTELFLAPDVDVHRPVIVFHHMRKTAGTSFKKLLETQLEMQRIDLWTPQDQGHPPSGNVGRWYKRMLGALGRDGRGRLGCVASHSANYLLPLIDCPAVAISLVREPVDRVMSRYYFSNRPSRGKALKTSRGPSLEEVYERFGGGSASMSEEHRKCAHFFSGQARSLLDPSCDTSELRFDEGPPEDADRWRERLDEALASYAWIGVQERFEPFVHAVGAELGWRIGSIPRSKANLERPSEPHSADAVEMIRRFNWLDDELYRRCAETLAARIDTQIPFASRPMAPDFPRRDGPGDAPAESDQAPLTTTARKEEGSKRKEAGRRRKQRLAQAAGPRASGNILTALGHTGVGSRRFVDIGCGSTGGTTGFLATELGWSGLLIDGSELAIERTGHMFESHGARAIQAFVTRENVNELLESEGMTGEIDVLSIDIDGNDYWIWEAITVVEPRVVVVEYNWRLGAEEALTIPYRPDFNRKDSNHIQGYHGASVAALASLAARKGYRLVACDPDGTNSFYVRDDLAPDLPRVEPALAYRVARHPSGAEWKPPEVFFEKFRNAGLEFETVG